MDVTPPEPPPKPPEIVAAEQAAKVAFDAALSMVPPIKMAARVGDMHVCPMLDGPKPHVGGPILPTGSLNVIIGGMPAARVTDKLVCVSPAPDVIVQGSPTVQINFLMAARLLDSTAHGGKIIIGFPTVIIGDSGSGGAGGGSGGGTGASATATNRTLTEGNPAPDQPLYNQIQAIKDAAANGTAYVPIDAPTVAAEPTASPDPQLGAGSANLVFRGDENPTSPLNAKGIPKSYLNEAGDLVPANPIGTYQGREVSVAEHILGGFRRGAKSNSPYTSFSPNGQVASSYGGQKITVDLAELRRSIESGEVEGVKILEQAQIQEQIGNATGLSDYWKNLASKWTSRDQEVLIMGIIPKQFIKVESVR